MHMYKRVKRELFLLRNGKIFLKEVLDRNCCYKIKQGKFYLRKINFLLLYNTFLLFVVQLLRHI